MPHTPGHQSYSGLPNLFGTLISDLEEEDPWGGIDVPEDRHWASIYGGEEPYGAVEQYEVGLEDLELEVLLSAAQEQVAAWNEEAEFYRANRIAQAQAAAQEQTAALSAGLTPPPPPVGAGAQEITTGSTAEPVVGQDIFNQEALREALSGRAARRQELYSSGAQIQRARDTYTGDELTEEINAVLDKLLVPSGNYTAQPHEVFSELESLGMAAHEVINWIDRDSWAGAIGRRGGNPNFYRMQIMGPSGYGMDPETLGDWFGTTETRGQGPGGIVVPPTVPTGMASAGRISRQEGDAANTVFPGSSVVSGDLDPPWSREIDAANYWDLEDANDAAMQSLRPSIPSSGAKREDLINWARTEAPEYLPTYEDPRSPWEYWSGIMAGQDPWEGIQGPLADLGINLAARYNLAVPYMLEAGSPKATFGDFIQDLDKYAQGKFLAQGAGGGRAGPQDQMLGYGSPGYYAEDYSDLVSRIREAGHIASLSDDDYHKYAADNMAKAVWYRDVYANPQNQLGAAQYLALQRPGYTGTDPSGRTYSGEMADLIRKHVTSAQKLYGARGAPPKSFLDYYQGQLTGDEMSSPADMMRYQAWRKVNP